MALGLWFAGLVGLVVAAAVASGRGRASPKDVVGRGVIASAGLAYAALVVAAVWTWGGATAASGRAERLRDGATVSLALRGMQVSIEGPISIGHGAEATVRVPGDGPAELARIDRAALAAPSHEPPAPALEPPPGPLGPLLMFRDDLNADASKRTGTSGSPAPASTTTRTPGSTSRPAATATQTSGSKGTGPASPATQTPGSKGTAPASPATRTPGSTPAAPALVVRAAASSVVLARVGHAEDPAAVATRRGCAPDGTAFTLPAGAAVVVIECGTTRPVRAFVVRRDAVQPQVVVTPLAWRGRFVAERLAARAGDVLRLGGGDAIPGLATWDVTAPRESTAMLAIPTDPTACAAWSPDVGAARAGTDGCIIEAGPFTIEALPLVPDPALVVERGLRAVFAIGMPPLLLLVALALRRRHGRRAHVFARALRLCMLGAALAALVCWRLLWAYRIDVLRELASIGPRVLDNQLAAIAIGAALAGNAMLVFAHSRRLLAALAGWAAWLVIGFLAADVAAPPLTSATVGVIGLSLIAALAPLGIELAKRYRARVGADVVLVALAGGAALGRAAAPSTTLFKLVLAYAIALAGYAALRATIAPETALGRRFRLAGALVIAACALASYDAGVALAITGTGLALAMLVAGHDAMYDATKSERIGLLEREHARVLLVHGVAAMLLAAGIAAWSVVASDRALIEQGSLAIMHAPLVMAVMFGLAALVARSHHRGWAPWLAAGLAALAIWGARDGLLEHATTGNGVSARRVAAHVEPGYALLSDERAFASSVSAWREAALAPSAEVDPWDGEGFFGARIRDPGVTRSLENDYLPVLVARELGVGGLVQGIALLLVVIVGAGTIAGIRLRQASREHRARSLVVGIAGVLVLYQPLAALGVVPLTGISWPGLGIDSPADLWLFVIGAVWCLLAGDTPTDDERVRGTPRLVRARRIVVVAVAVGGIAAVILVARAGTCALDRVTTDDDRIASALSYAETLTCGPERTGPTIDAVLPATVAGEPTDEATARFDRELRARWILARPGLSAALGKPACEGRAGGWQLATRDDACIATLGVGWPEIELTVRREPDQIRATCRVVRDDDAISVLRARPRLHPSPRIRVVSAAMGVAATDLGELVAGSRIVRLRPKAPALALAALAAGSHPAGRVTVSEGVTLEVGPRGVLLRGPAELFVSEAAAWRRVLHAGELVLDRVTLIASGPPDRRSIVLFRPPRAWGGAAVIDPLLADDAHRLGDRTRRAYPYGAALPELGWINPFDVERSLGLDGWVHAAYARPAAVASSCGTLAPPAIERERVCTPNPVDGVLECRVTIQPELAQSLRALVDDLLEKPTPYTGRDIDPVRAAYVVLRGDTGELLAQGNVVPGREPLAYAPIDPHAEAELVRLRNERGESDGERVEWNLPIAVGSTFKPIVARAAEQVAPQQVAALSLTAGGYVEGCRSRRGVQVSPIMGHCPPTSVAGTPTTADIHDFLAYSPNWYQAALGLLGLSFPSGPIDAGDLRVTLDEVLASDISSWPTERKLLLADASGPILSKRGLSIAGLRRTPLWSRIEQLLGRPLCTLGDRAKCDRVAARADTCAARALPVTAGADLRYLVALGPDRIDPYAGDRPKQTSIPVREYLQVLRGSGVHPIGSLAQLTDAFGRVIYDPSTGPSRLAASWFPAPVTGVVPAWSCAAASGHAATVLGADGGLCGVLRPGGTGHRGAGDLLADKHLVVYGAKSGTSDSLAGIARRKSSCAAWNKRHPNGPQLVCGRTPPDDSLFVIAFGVVTPRGTIPITLGIQLQRAGAGAASRATPAFVRAIATYFRGE